ncbi:hypothetical protein CCR75_000257 [Bremia lactucae]|uniref:GCF C-terminal domain-containing protein n=1 Tax=Bremia lactucae TaxID=4779 RepID=A0A976FE87_BRELC|nr:hypothetical protein CCR75_000257 [Bremia lactucae]
MFRVKDKKGGGRKRRDVEVENDHEAAVASQNDNLISGFDSVSSSSAVEVESELQELVKLRQGRFRPVKSAMSFSSKSTTVRTSGSSSSRSTAAVSVDTNGLLSFDDEEHQNKQKQRKMRPNLVVSSSVEVEIEEQVPGKYSAQMLTSLRSEQRVLLSHKKEEVTEDTAMQMEQGIDEDTTDHVIETEEEEFISLEGGKKKLKLSKDRVTFGKQSDNVEMLKTTEVVEALSEEDEEESQRWEEELMSRGGHRVPAVSKPTDSSQDGQPIYPTRRKVATVSLGSVLGKLEKSLEITTLEDERTLRELARLETEVALIEKTNMHQQEELLVSSEEFEYFQDIEDFVKGLSFCLREKIRVIEVKKEEIMNEREQQVRKIRQEEKLAIEAEVKFYVNSGVLQPGAIFGQFRDNYEDAKVEPHTNIQHEACILKHQHHYTDPYKVASQSEDDDLFADTIDEMNSLEHVYGRFQEWKAKFPQVYKSTYCELAQTKLFAPYVQAEVLYWDPLTAADAMTTFDDFLWHRILRQHVRRIGGFDAVDGPMLYQIRNILLEKVYAAVSRYFDPFSNLHSRSLSLILEEITRHGYLSSVEDMVQSLVNVALEAFSSEASVIIIVAIDESTAESSNDINVFSRYLLKRFNALLDNLLTLFVALPSGPIAAAGFQCLLQVLDQVLAYARFSQDRQSMKQMNTAMQVVRKLSGSSYLLQLLKVPNQERELKHMLTLFEPFI